MKLEKVKIILKDGNIFEGILLPKTEYDFDNVLILKLKNGYNIGISKDKIEKIEKIGEFKKEFKKLEKMKINSANKNVLVLTTGGTIASNVDYITGGVSPSLDAEDLLKFAPEISEFANIENKTIFMKFSEDLMPEDWLKIAKEIEKNYESFDAVVILHGTDTMHYTASALSFLLPIGYFVSLTGAQRSSDRPSTDAFLNFYYAVKAAALSKIGEVNICFHETIEDKTNLIIRGNRARKMHTSARNAFKSINYPPLARIGKNIEYLADYYEKRDDLEFDLPNKLDAKVAIVKTYPGADAEILNYYAERKYEAVVIEATGLGNVPINVKNSWLDKIKELSDEMLFVITSQTIYGRTHPFVYTNLRKISRYALFLEDMITETAYTKLIVGLSKKEDIIQYMKKNIAGEISNRTIEIK